MKATITGGSDDLIEIGGDIEDEFNVYLKDDEVGLLAVSDGTVLEVDYDRDGIWRFKRIAKGSATFSKVEGDIEEDTFDVVTLEGDIAWIVWGDKMTRRINRQEQE